MPVVRFTVNPKNNVPTKHKTKTPTILARNLLGTRPIHIIRKQVTPNITAVEKLERESKPTISADQKIITHKSLALYSICCLLANIADKFVISTSRAKSDV